MKSILCTCAFVIGFLLHGSIAFAQGDATILRAQRIYEFLVAGQGDSIQVYARKDLREKFAPELFNTMFKSIEAQVGGLQSHGEWQKQPVPGQALTICLMDLQFKMQSLRLQITLDEENAMVGIFLQPIAATSFAEPTDAEYKEWLEERDIMVGADGYQLSGTLTLPRKAVAEGRKVPCLILVHGSGPNDRDETIGPNKPFRELAQGLGKRMIAVVRYDKRTKVYGGNYIPAGREADYDAETVDDALSAIEQTRTWNEIDKDSIYLLGHSLGGTLAPRIAERSEGLNGIIICAGLVRPMEDALMEQSAYILSLKEATPEEQSGLAVLEKQCVNVKMLGTDGFDGSLSLPLGLPRSYWMFAHSYKPVEVAAKLRLPMFILQGERDYQVTMEDFDLWRSGLSQCPNVCFKSYPKLNHLFQEGNGKSTPHEYMQAASIPEYVMDDLAVFIRTAQVI